MKKILFFSILIPVFFSIPSLYATQTGNAVKNTETFHLETQIQVFRRHIPAIAEGFIGIPFQYGGNPQLTGTTDNSHLFYSIYALAAEKSRMIFKSYMPMKMLLQNVDPVNENEIQNGDLIVLKNNHAAMLYKIEPTGKIYCIYASGKRQEVLSFNSDNIVFHVYWLENIKGFYRLKNTVFQIDK